jgi:thymidylate kinase
MKIYIYLKRFLASAYVYDFLALKTGFEYIDNSHYILPNDSRPQKAIDQTVAEI